MAISFKTINLNKSIINYSIQLRFIHKNSGASFSQLGSTFNQRPAYQQNVKTNFTDFTKIFSSIKVPSYLNSGKKAVFEGFYDLQKKANN